MSKRKLNRLIFFLLLSIFYILMPATVAKGSNDVIWDSNQVLGQKGAHDFAGIYEFDNLTIGDNVEITSSGISQLVIKVNGTLKLGKNATIRVRNGFYPNAPANPIAGLTEATINNLGTDAGGFRVYEGMFGRGGNGGCAGDGVLTFTGGGGGGGYGGGIGGAGTGSGAAGQSNGGRGGDTASDGVGIGGVGGGAIGIGSQGSRSTTYLHSGGGGGNGGAGVGAPYDTLYRIGGGGGGGYGGGVLSIIAHNLTYDLSAPPSLLVSGQNGGAGGRGNNAPAGSPGNNGQAGLLILNVPNSSLTTSLWNLKSTNSFGGNINSNNGGHGIISGDPQKVFLNSLEYVPPTGVAIIPASLKVPIQGTKLLNVSISPSNATLKDVIWSSSDSSYASVDSNGVVTGNKLGVTNINAKIAEGLVNSCPVTVVPKATSVTLDKKELWLTVNSGLTTLNTTVTPIEALNWATWKSSNEAVATVNAVGGITPLTSGTAIITATSEDLGMTDTCTVIVYPANHMLLSGVTLQDLTLPVGTYRPLQVTFHPANATNKDVIWSSSDSTIASVDSHGLVTGIAGGITTITAKTVEGGFTASCAVTVEPPVTGISLDKKELWFTVNGSTTSLKATITPAGAKNEVLWSSDNPAVATVDSAGLVTPVASGKARITAQSEDGGYTAYCDVNVWSALISQASVIPAINSTTAAIDSKVKVVFTKDMGNNSGINGSTFYLEHQGNLVPASIDFPDRNQSTSVFRTVQLTPVQSLINSAVYTVRLTHDVKSKDGNSLGNSALSDISWNFTTAKSVTSEITDIPWPMYMHDARHTGQSTGVITQSSALKWKKSFGSGPLLSPALSTDGIFVGDAGVRALNLDGSVKWTYSNGTTDLTPIVTQGFIYNLVNSKLVTLDTLGVVKSSLSYVEGFQHFYPLVIDDRGNILAVTSTLNNQAGRSPYSTQLHAFNTQTAASTTLWNQNLTTSFDGLLSCPPAIDSLGTVYIAISSKLYSISGSGNQIWSENSADATNITSISLGKDNRIYITTLGGVVQVLNSSGQTLWSKSYGKSVTPVALSNDGEAFFGSGDGKVYILDANDNEIRQINVGASLIAPPILDQAKNIVVGSVNGWVYSFKHDGTERWRFQTDGQITEPAALGGDGTVYITSNDGYLYAIGGSVLELSGEQTIAPINSEIACKLNVSEVANLAGVSTEIRFDNSVVEVSSISKGVFFNNTINPLTASSGWVTQDNYSYNNSQGIIKIAGSKIGNDSFSGSTSLATIVFKTKAKGITLLTINSFNLVDKNSNSISPLKKDTVLEVTTGSSLIGTLNSEGKPDYRDFTVCLEDETGKVVREIKPLSNWHFVFSDVPTGVYSISVTSPVYLRERTDSIVMETANIFKDVGTITVVTGDLDKNNLVDVLDLVIFANAYETVPGDQKWKNIADFNKDNRIDILDLTYLSRNLDKSGAEAPSR